MTFDLSHVLVLACEEPREQAVSVNEGDYLSGLGRTVRLKDRLEGGERWVIVLWVYPNRHVRREQVWSERWSVGECIVCNLVW